MVLIQILIATLAISLISLVGVLLLSVKEEWLTKALFSLVALAAGTLLGAAFLHLVPEAIEQVGDYSGIFLYVLLGFVFFFILEQFLYWQYHHNMEQRIQPFSYLILFSDGLHNFLDGLAIAASFMVSFPLGMATTLAVAVHEIPQELGDFGALVSGGLSRRQALTFNSLSGIMAVVGGIIGFFVFSHMQTSIAYLLLFASGSFIYIAAADLIPIIKQEAGLRRSIMHFFIFLVGIALMMVIE
jgi:zinc and cadmium transporter